MTKMTRIFAVGVATLVVWIAGDLTAMPAETHQGQSQSGVDPFSDDRARMVKTQIVARGVTDSAVVHAMLTVPRHRFIPLQYQDKAYGDFPLPIGHEQTISQPYIVAAMTEALNLNPGNRILEIGTGSGYQAAVLAELVDSVYTIEIVEPLGLRAESTLNSLANNNIHVRIGDGYRGWPEAAPFDAIIVTAAPGHIPQPLVDQLSFGGRMVLPLGTDDQTLVKLTKSPEGIIREERFAVRFVPMTGEAMKKDTSEDGAVDSSK